MSRPGFAPSLALVAGLLTACMPVDNLPPGPTLTLEVTNLSERVVPFSYEWESENGMGSGEGEALACERSTGAWGSVAGAYAISVGGEEVFEGRVPEATPAEGYWVVRVHIDMDARPKIVGAPNWSRMAPIQDAELIPGCG